MSATDEKDQQLINDLQKLPKLNDGLSKEEWYQKIKQKEFSNSKPNRKPLLYIVPSLMGVLVLVLLFIITEGFNFNSTTNNRAEDLEEAEMSTSQDVSMEILEKSTHADDTLAFTFHEETTLNEVTRGEHVLFQDEQDIMNLPMAPVGAMDESVMFAVPLTMINTPNEQAVFYNEIIREINFKSHGLTSLPFSLVTFGFQNQQLAEIVVDDSDQLAGTSAQATLFLQTLRTMFATDEPTSIPIRTSETDDVDLGAYGEVSTFEFMPVKQVAYKYYRFDETHTYMVPVEQTLAGENFMTIDEALFNMQESNEELKLFGAIPADAEYQLDLSDTGLLQMTFAEHDMFGDNLATIEMIESILMTAKSFDFDAVNFSIAGVDSTVGAYQLNAPLDVPLAINPTTLEHWLEYSE
ncbi:hypothetical protein DES38_104142 [Streptohalobacillus salinus]|uniref:Sporulation and spore germination protein n=1 Tax=Streptohalobacillus salinus TaxID=621096 RepID=A0A2V3WSK8_9BACI|nr:hypothetical protein [Streptohalobacillus salinus]PXW91709.1 hypothetical protein DES38_104142 [Streptohalobacillus salinus]